MCYCILFPSKHSSILGLHQSKSEPLYKLILSHHWEGISWLILSDLNTYKLNQFDIIQSAILSLEIDLAIRLLQKFSAETENKMSFKKELTQYLCDANDRSLLHLIASLDLTASHLAENVKYLLRIIFTESSISPVHAVQQQLLMDDFIMKQDKLGATAMHYACHMHNFEFIDFILEQFSSSKNVNPERLFTAKDQAQQTAYALLFWQVGRCTYAGKSFEKIKLYTDSYFKSNNNLEFISRAYFPLVQAFDSFDKVGLLQDYPNTVKTGQLLVNPLIYAINRKDREVVRFLIKELSYNVNTCDSTNKCALVYAMQTNSLNMCMLLLNPDMFDENGIELNDLATNSNKSIKKNRISRYFCYAI